MNRKAAGIALVAIILTGLTAVATLVGGSGAAEDEAFGAVEIPRPARNRPPHPFKECEAGFQQILEFQRTYPSSQRTQILYLRFFNSLEGSDATLADIIRFYRQYRADLLKAPVAASALHNMAIAAARRSRDPVEVALRDPLMQLFRDKVGRDPASLPYVAAAWVSMPAGSGWTEVVRNEVQKSGVYEDQILFALWLADLSGKELDLRGTDLSTGKPVSSREMLGDTLTIAIIRGPTVPSSLVRVAESKLAEGRLGRIPPLTVFTSAPDRTSQGVKRLLEAQMPVMLAAQGWGAAIPVDVPRVDFTVDGQHRIRAVGDGTPGGYFANTAPLPAK